MRRTLFFIAICLSMIDLTANDYVETYNSVSDAYNDSKSDIQVIRQINGGTVITPIFDPSCPKEMEGPFSYACKIVEEYMPSCLPLKIKVSCGRINSSISGVVSKVNSRSKENFGDCVNYSNATMATIKGVILGELNYNSSSTYLDSVPNLDFLTNTF